MARLGDRPRVARRHDPSGSLVVTHVSSPPTGDRTGPAADDQGIGGWLGRHGRDLGLRRVEDLIDPSGYEATALLAQFEDRGAPPVVFARTRDLSGSESPFGIVFNLYGNRASLGRALGVDPGSWPALLEGYSRRADRPRPPSRVGDAPAQRHRLLGEEVDLAVLPWVRHVEGEGGAFFTPIAVSRQPDGPRYNLSWNRAMYLDRSHIGVHISPRQLWGFHREAEERGEDLPVALVLGHHPAFNLAAASMTPMSVDEYDVAGALLGEGLRIVPSVTFGDRLWVPADADVVIEGRLLAGRRVVEGPFGEYMRYLGPQKLSNLFVADAITWRDSPLITEIFAGHADHLNAHVSIHAHYLHRAREAVPQVTGVAWFEGGGPTTAVIAMHKSAEGQPMRAAMAVLAASNIVKQVIVVDDDIDIYDAGRVLWAVSTRVRADRDIEIVRNLQGNLLDPSQVGFGAASGVVVDATWPLDQTPAPIARVPAEAVAAHPLEHYTITEP